MSLRFGLQIPFFNYGQNTYDIRPTLIRQVTEAEEHGFDAVFVMDHLYQIKFFGHYDDPMLEAYTTLGALAAVTKKIQLGALVSANIYRNPTLLAKAITTLDVLSQGRAILGIGAGWFEKEAEDFGFEFGSFAERFDKLTEALEIITPMLLGEEVDFDGQWYKAHHVLNNPQIRNSLPILLGGSGEKRTFPLAVKYAKYLNMNCSYKEIPHKLQVLEQLLLQEKRSRRDIEVSAVASVIYEPTSAAAEDKRQEILDYVNTPDNQLTSQDRSHITESQVVGTLDEVVEQIKTHFFDQGVDGIIVNLPGNGWLPGKIAQLGDALQRVCS